MKSVCLNEFIFFSQEKRIFTNSLKKAYWKTLNTTFITRKQNFSCYRSVGNRKGFLLANPTQLILSNISGVVTTWKNSQQLWEMMNSNLKETFENFFIHSHTICSYKGKTLGFRTAKTFHQSSIQSIHTPTNPFEQSLRFQSRLWGL